MSTDQLRALIEPAADLADADRVQEAESAFSELLRHNPEASPIRELDLYTAFGVELCGQSSSPEASFPYLRRAVELAAAAFGPDHPEEALAYTDLGDCLAKVEATKGSAERRAAYASAYRIRLASLGARSGETAASMRGMASAIKDEDIATIDPAQLQQAFELYDKALETFRSLGAQSDVTDTLADRAELSAEAGRMDAAVADFAALPSASLRDELVRSHVCAKISDGFRGRGDSAKAAEWSGRCEQLKGPVRDLLAPWLSKPK